MLRNADPRSSADLADSYTACRAVVARSRSSFRPAFRVLPAPKREAMDALYAFARLTDDIADEPGAPDDKRRKLLTWQRDLWAAERTHPIQPAIRHTVAKFGIPRAYLDELIAGCAMDIDPVPMSSFDELKRYCYRVSCVVGLSCVRIWGLQAGVPGYEAESPALSAGYAFQLTNILRDVAEDARAGRVYLPQDELAAANVIPPTWSHFAEFLPAQLERVFGYYSEAAKLTPLLSSEGQRIYTVMFTAYRLLAERLCEAGPALLTHRVRLSTVQKLRLWWLTR